MDSQRKCYKCGILKDFTAENFRAKKGELITLCVECDKTRKKEYHHATKVERKARELARTDLPTEKICDDCSKLKPLNDENFGRHTGKFLNICRECSRKRASDSYNENIDENREKQKEYKKNNPDKAAQWNRNRREKKKTDAEYYSRTLQLQSESYYRNRDERLARSKSPEIKSRRNARLRVRYRTDPQYKAEHNLRCRLWHALKGVASKQGSTKELVGCEYDFLIKYLESTLTNGMTMQDYMDGKIHVDHIIPCAVWDLTRKDHQLRCFHYSNLNFMWGEDNLAKNDNVFYNGKVVSASGLSQFEKQEVINSIKIPSGITSDCVYHSVSPMLPIAGKIKPLQLI